MRTRPHSGSVLSFVGVVLLATSSAVASPATDHDASHSTPGLRTLTRQAVRQAGASARRTGQQARRVGRAARAMQPNARSLPRAVRDAAIGD